MNPPPLDPTKAPIAATLSILAAMASSLVATVTGIMSYHWISPVEWMTLAAALMVLLLVVLHRPDTFRVRRFRLPGILVVALCLILITPLPGIVREYGAQVPRTMILSIALGILATAIVFLVAPQPSEVHREHIRRESEQGVAVAITALAIIVFPIWLRSLPSIPILDLLRGGSTGIEIANARNDASFSLTSVPLRVAVAVIRNLYLMFAVAWLVSDWVLTPKRQWRTRSSRRLVAGAAAGIAAMYALVTTERAILGQVVIVVAVAALVASRKPLRTKTLALLAPIVIGFPLIFGLLVSTGGGSTRFEASIAAFRRRSFFLPGDVMTHYFTAFPARHDFLHGGSIPKLSYVVGGNTFDLSSFIYDTYYRVSDSLDGIANGSYLGVGWANFGMFGVVVWSVAAAVAVVALDHTIDRLPIRTGAALRGVSVVQVGLLTSVDVFRSVLGFAPGPLDLLLVAWFLVWLDRRRSYRATVAASALSDEGVAVPS